MNNWQPGEGKEGKGGNKEQLGSNTVVSASGGDREKETHGAVE